MPRYGYGYAQSPDDMATGNPFYNPNRPGPDWAAGVAAFYQNLQQAKDRKRAQQQQDEELRWQRYAQEQAMKENARKEQERALALQDKAQKDAEARGKRIREKMAAFEESSPLPKLRQAQVAKFHGYEPTEFSALPGKRQRELENEMVNQTGRINERSTTSGSADKPSDYDKKVNPAKELFKAGKITEQEYNRVVTGYTGEETEKDV